VKEKLDENKIFDDKLFEQITINNNLKNTISNLNLNISNLNIEIEELKSKSFDNKDNNLKYKKM